MRHAIETAPKNGQFVILEDDANALCDVGRWSPEAGGWVGKDNAPLKVEPTHWHPLARDAYLQADEGAAGVDRVGGSALRRFIAPAAGVVAAAMVVLYFVKQETAERPASDGIVAHNARPPTAESQVRSPAEETQTVRERGAAATPVPDAQQSLSRKPSDIPAQEAAGAQELGKARRTIERLEGQLRAGATTEQMLKQERERAGTLAEQVAAARLALTESIAQRHQAIQEERSRNAALKIELAAVRREIETQAAQSRKASDERALLKQTETAKSEQQLEQQRQKMAAALAEAAAARQDLTASAAQHSQALCPAVSRIVRLAPCRPEKGPAISRPRPFRPGCDPGPAGLAATCAVRA